jgi:hypothetical protein
VQLAGFGEFRVGEIAIEQGAMVLAMMPGEGAVMKFSANAPLAAAWKRLISDSIAPVS